MRFRNRLIFEGSPVRTVLEHLTRWRAQHVFLMSECAMALFSGDDSLIVAEGINEL